jgi:Glycosyltransferases involved in cell wall biogenesis
MNTAAATPRVALVVAAYNEGVVIAEVVKDACRKFPDVIVVDDGSRDATGDIALAAGATVLTHPINLGQGAALQTGIEFAVAQGFDYVATFDADGQHDPDDVQAMVAALEGTGTQIALGSRFIRHADSVPPARRLLLRAATVFTRVTTGMNVSDAHNGLRVLRADAARCIRLRQNRMAHASEILEEIGRHRLSYVEVPVHIRYTKYSIAKGQSGLGAFNIMLDLFLARLRK